MHSKTIHSLSVEPGSRIAGRYEVRDRLGSGGMGVVYRCVDRDLGDVVALKLLHAHLAQDEEVFARFRNEVLVARALSHPNIVRLHDMGKAEEGFSYISMELVDGYSLHDRVSRRKAHPEMPTDPLTFREALEYLYQICCGVAYAHDKGIIHRDLKPANVMISTAGEVKLADFGTARIVGMDRSLTQAGQVIGTPDYMAPEQIRGEQLDSSCDIYALGIIAYELAVGNKPFIAESAVAIAFKHLNEPIPAFANPSMGIPKWYEDIVKKATAKDRKERYPSAFEFAQALCENAPELRNKSVLFMSESRAASRSTIDAPRPPLSTSSSDSSYHLGDQQSSAGDSWVFGSYSPEDGISNPPTPTTISMRRRSPLITALGIFGALFVALIVSVRFVSPLNQLAARSLPQWEEQLHVDLSWLASTLGVSHLASKIGEPSEREEGGASVAPDFVVPLNNSSVVSSEASSPSTTARELDDLEKELLSEAGVSSLDLAAAAAAHGSSVVSANPASPLAVSSASLPSSIAAQSSQVSVSSSSISNVSNEHESSAAASSERASTSEELFAAATLSGAVILSEAQGGEVVSALDTSKLKFAQWRSVVNGVPTGFADAVLKKLIREKLTARVVNAESGKAVGNLDFRIQKAPTPEDPSLILSGNFSSLRDTEALPPGAYRLEVLHGDTLVKAREFTLFKLSVAAAATGAPTAGVQVLTVPTYVPAKESAPPPPTPPVGAEGPVTTQTPNVTIVTPPPPPPPIVVPPGSTNSRNSLPPARRGADEILSNSESSSVAALITEPSSPAAVAETPAEIYLGRIYTEGSEGSTEGKRLELRLTFEGVTISGTASIDGFGEYNVDGTVYQRGVELNLRGNPSIRLSAGRRESTLRGRFNIPSDQKSGSWVASKR